MSAVPLPSGFQVRPPTMADLTAVFALITACEVADDGAPDTLVADLREAWQGHDLAADAIVVRAPDHHVVGLATIEGQTRLHAEVYVHPADRVPGLAAYLEGWLDTRAHARAALVADHAEVVLDRIVNGATDAAGQHLRAAGYTVVRHHWRMRIDLAPPRPPHHGQAATRCCAAVIRLHPERRLDHLGEPRAGETSCGRTSNIRRGRWCDGTVCAPVLPHA